MIAPTPDQLLARAHDRRLLALDRERYLDDLADGRTSEPDVEPDWNDPDDPGAWPEEGTP